jgi:beta-lactamase class A
VTGVAWSISLREADTDRVIAEESAGEVLRTASVGKVLLLFRMAELLERGAVAPDQLLTRLPADAVADSGIWQYLSADRMTILDLCELVGMVSDNLATNVLLRLAGVEGVASTASRRGMRATALHDRVRDVRGPDDPPTLSSGTAAELAHLMSGLHRGALVGGGVTGRVHGWLGKGMDLSQVAAGWGLDPLAHLAADRGLRLVHKTGTDLGVRADIGVLTGPAASVAYAVIANWEDSAFPELRDEVLDRQRSVGRSIAEIARGGSWPDRLPCDW